MIKQLSSRDSVDIWNEIMYRQYGFNETLSPIPTTIFSQGDGIDSCTVYGNAVQNEIPTYDNPIQPQECGERSSNLWDGQSYEGYLKADGTYMSPDNTTLSIIIKCEPNTQYAIKQVRNQDVAHKWRIAVFSALPVNNSQGTVLVDNDNLSESTITTLSDSEYIVVYYIYAGSPPRGVFMVNEGSEILPYEMWGYKIPILCDNQITNIYLGETQSTRVIKKLILTGEENWQQQSGHTADYFRIPNMPGIPSKVLCTHYVSPDDNIVYANTVTGIKMQQSATYGVIIACRPPNASSLSGFKQFLANEYAAGHPVTVYYVMATPETTILNEPLMKVENYADSVVYGSNIPTTFGQNDIDVNTQIKPLKLDITYNALRRAKVYKNDRWILNPSIDWSQTLKISDLQSKKIKEMEGEYIGYNIHT